MSLFKKPQLILYIKDHPIFNITKEEILDFNHLPEVIAKNPTEHSFHIWRSSRKSSESNKTAMTLLNLAFGHNLNKLVKNTKLLSLSDCYWVKYDNDQTKFASITPYLGRFWGEHLNLIHKYKEGSVPTLMTNGVLDKHWISKEYLQKPYNMNEYDSYVLCKTLGIPVSEYIIDHDRLLVKNFTDIDNYLEPANSYILYSNQGYTSVDIINDFDFGLEMIIIDTIIKNTDRHTGNFGYLININSGKKVQAPLFDFDKALNPTVSTDYMIDDLLALYRLMGSPNFIKQTILNFATKIVTNADKLNKQFVSRAKFLANKIQETA
ncbi:hypothetical protein AN640_04105 [Candidatus Epulonipiscium fishelsonii]|uniref:Uncharacterized protein n=1 Tax=Candidatus Epulonipiscium fishelsonii TaxID=77094 RepID=A0ACC8XJ00_9FIRM|nr:hypothetical protein AN640_04105 [Epulopiscium sp. SCG-D08WGA-EpuloA1]